MPICSAADRSIRSMKRSPAISSENRVQRWQSTHRSRSSSTWVRDVDRLRVLALVLVEPGVGRPVDIAWFCSGHSPPLSHIGQSSGWLISSSSMIPSCAFAATGEVSWVVHDHAVGDGLGARGDRLALALDLDQALPAGAGRRQQRVVAEAGDLDANLLGDPDQQRTLGRGDLDPVDGEGDVVAAQT